ATRYIGKESLSMAIATRSTAKITRHSPAFTALNSTALLLPVYSARYSLSEVSPGVRNRFPMVRKNTMPAMETGMPTLPSSKKVIVGTPRSSRAPLTTTLLAAPISVRLQPKLAAKDMGISCRETETPARWLTLMTMGSSIATTATPLHTAEIIVATSIKAIMMPFSDVPVNLTRTSAILAAMPVWKRAEPTTIIAATRTMVLPEKALNNSAGSMIPHNTKTLPPSIATRAAGSFSVTKNTTIT
ncbi:permease prefix domain 1-containing protein, partial [Dysosmobacter welbionis]